MVLWPERAGDPSAFFQHLTNLRVNRWKQAHDEIGRGHLEQGRFKSFPAQIWWLSPFPTFPSIDI